MIRHRSIAALVTTCAAAFLVVGPASGSTTAPSTRPNTSSPVMAGSPASIEWREWSKAAFDEARDKRRLVLLDITATWCHWCRVMAEESYTDSAVIAQINTNFIPIRVDYDLRPDIGDRYLTNGWPTTAVLSANGHLLLAKTYLPPAALREFLKESIHFYRVNHVQVDRKVAEAEKAVERTWAPDSLLAPTLSEDEYIERNVQALLDLEDKEHGGFGTAPKTARWDAISFLLRAADARQDDEARALAVRATAAALALQDSVDGGFFRMALEPNWTKFRYERLLNEQASALSILTRVARATGETRFKTAADRVRAFVERSFPRVAWRDHDVLGNAGHVQALGPDVRQSGGRWIDGDVYFRLSAGARPRAGRLVPSKYLTSDAAFRYESAELRAHASRSEESSVKAIGRAMREGVPVRHAAFGDGRTGLGLLIDQAAYGNALLDDYEAGGANSRGVWATGDPADAESLAKWMQANLEDREGGGFRYAPRDPAAIGRLRAGDKPELANVEAATFFLRLYWLTGRQEYKDVAARTALYLQSGDKIVLDPTRAELVLRLRQEPVRLLVIGAKGKPKLTRDLAAAALDAPVPETVVRYLDPSAKSSGKVAWPNVPPPDAKSPAIYRWTSTGWRGPVTDPAKLGDILDRPGAQP